MTGFRFRIASAIAASAVLVVTGCASPPIEAEPPALAPPVGVAASSPTPTPTPVRPPRLPALQDLVITPSGIGSLLVGKPVTGTDMVRFEAEHCAESFAQDGITADPGAWIPNYPNIGEEGHVFDVLITDNVVHAIEINDPTLRTAKGIGLGSTLGELTEVYPSLAAGLEGLVSKSLILAGDGGEIVFEVMTADLGDRSDPGDLISMRIFPPGAADPSLTAATDSVYRNC